MKVSELIEQLKLMPQDAEVRVEGCDCDGEAVGAGIIPEWAFCAGDVVIARAEDMYGVLDSDN